MYGQQHWCENWTPSVNRIWAGEKGAANSSSRLFTSNRCCCAAVGRVLFLLLWSSLKLLNTGNALSRFPIECNVKMRRFGGAIKLFSYFFILVILCLGVQCNGDSNNQGKILFVPLFPLDACYWLYFIFPANESLHQLCFHWKYSDKKSRDRPHRPVGTRKSSSVQCANRARSSRGEKRILSSNAQTRKTYYIKSF